MNYSSRAARGHKGRCSWHAGAALGSSSALSSLSNLAASGAASGKAKCKLPNVSGRPTGWGLAWYQHESGRSLAFLYLLWLLCPTQMG
eukprot:4433808-Amphidinium_carterae.1